MDVLEEDGNLVIKAELPGVKQEDVDITVHERVLTISGQRREETETERGGYHVRERRRGAFSRSVMLPQDVNEDRIRARYEDGVLEVTVEGAAAVREPKRIRSRAAPATRAPTAKLLAARDGRRPSGSRRRGRVANGPGASLALVQGNLR
jgi:HSP20 family protein